MSILQQLMQNPRGMRLIDDQGVLSVGTIEPNTGTIQLSGGKKINQVNDGAILKTNQDGNTTLMAPNFPNQQPSANTRSKTSFLQKFQSLPADVLMRAGAAGLGADSLPKGLSAAGKEYADFFQTQTPEAKMDRALDIYTKINTINKINAATNKKVEDDQKYIGELTSVANQFKSASELLNANPNAVGLGFNTILRDLTGIDLAGFGDDPKAGIRSQLQTLKISETLLNTAKTKGAISNAEMNIFMSDQPKFSYSNDQWQTWLRKRQEAINTILNRLNSGQTVPLADQPSDDAIKKLDEMEDSWISGLTGGLFSGSSDDVSAGNADMEAADAIIN